MHSQSSDVRVASRSTSTLLALPLALIATGTSAWISIVAGVERGGTTGERFAWAAVALVVLLAAHLLPALTRNETLQIKLIALALWLVCILGTTYGHATFFLEAQQHAGAQRAATLQAELPSTPTRPVAVRGRDVIARDQARVAQQLAAARAERCAASCAALAARREALSAKLAALATEAEVAKRAELAADRAEEERQMFNARLDKARLDPVTSRVAQFLQLPHDVVDLTIALVFGLLLECVACIGWLQVFGQRAVGPVERGHAHDRTVEAAVTVSHEPVTASRDAAMSEEAAEVSSNVALEPSHEVVSVASKEDAVAVERVIPSEALSLANAIARGDVRPTVAGIRQYLRCSQARAAHMRKMVLPILEATTSDVSMAAQHIAREGGWPRLVHSSARCIA
ncbi:hypothetical protein [Burkholderia multivorans]|uniref:hypothetical protein n=1 Tax=Burkholderia multivorans TaxID=87883 RepID=UPI0021596FC4|nr:hypothetical protein [Burkholderia multivorans]